MVPLQAIEEQELEFLERMRNSVDNQAYIMEKPGLPYREGRVDKETQEVLDGMVEKGWIKTVPGGYVSYQLTEEGIIAYEAQVKPAETRRNS